MLLTFPCPQFFLLVANVDTHDAELLEALTELHARLDYLSNRISQVVLQINSVFAQLNLLRRRVELLEGRSQNTDDLEPPAPAGLLDQLD